MTDDAGVDVRTLRSQVRAAQHARSLPLIVIGVLLVNYAVGEFAPHPVEWRYGAPLAFVIVWGLSYSIESRTGVGPGRADYLIGAGTVFAATSVVVLRPFTYWFTTVPGVEGAWIIVVGVTLAALAAAGRDVVVAVAGVAVMAAGLYTSVFGSHDQSGPGIFANPQTELTHFAVTGWTGVLLVMAGLFFYRQERQTI